MSRCKAFGLAILAAGCLLGGTTGSAQAQCVLSSESTNCATEWNGGGATKLDALPDYASSNAASINDAGQVAGLSVTASAGIATE